MAKQTKTDEQPAVHPSNQTKYEALAVEIDAGLSDAERAAVKALADAGWVVLIQPRVENSTTGRGIRSFSAKGRYRIGLVRDRIMR